MDIDNTPCNDKDCYWLTPRMHRAYNKDEWQKVLFGDTFAFKLAWKTYYSAFFAGFDM